MKTTIITILLIFTSFLHALAWGTEGHAAVAYIAERNITPATKAALDKYLAGESIVKYASWMDHVRNQSAYSHSNGWHSAQVSANGKFKIWREDKYRVDFGLNDVMSKVENGGYREMSDSAVAVAIKMVVHLIGDMHCPAHTFFEGTPQKISFTIYGKQYVFHKFWDGGLFKLAHNWSSSDYQKNLDNRTETERMLMQKGTLIEWIEENARNIRPIYEVLINGREFDEKESSTLVPMMLGLAHEQVLKAGYRLAHVLNSIFDPDYEAWIR